MRVAISLVVSLLVSVLAGVDAHAAGARWGSPLTITVKVRAAPDIPRHLVQDLLAEAEAIWRSCGIRFVWRVEPAIRHASTGDDASMLRVTIDDDPGPDRSALGWVLLDRSDSAEEIHLSHGNALAALEREARFAAATFPRMRLEGLLAPALGRALAHELGHVLLQLPEHPPRGLMRAAWSFEDLFGPDTPRCSIDAAQRAAIVTRVMRATLLAQR